MKFTRLIRSTYTCIAISLFAAGAAAHHGGGVQFQDTELQTVTGTATEFQFRFPHVAVFIDVEVDGQVENWAMTTRWTPTILRRSGWRNDTIEVGDEITVTYRPHVTLPRVFQMRTIQVNGTELRLGQ